MAPYEYFLIVLLLLLSLLLLLFGVTISAYHKLSLRILRFIDVYFRIELFHGSQL